MTIRTIHYNGRNRPAERIEEANGHFVARGESVIEDGIYLLREDVVAYLRGIDSRGNSNAELLDAANHISTVR